MSFLEDHRARETATARRRYRRCWTVEEGARVWQGLLDVEGLMLGSDVFLVGVGVAAGVEGVWEETAS